MKWGCGPRRSRLHPCMFKDPLRGLPAVVQAVGGPSSAPAPLPPLRAGGLKRLKWQEWGASPPPWGPQPPAWGPGRGFQLGCPRLLPHPACGSCRRGPGLCRAGSGAAPGGPGSGSKADGGLGVRRQLVRASGLVVRRVNLFSCLGRGHTERTFRAADPSGRGPRPGPFTAQAVRQRGLASWEAGVTRL